eukprot:8183166-Lingulodinium_polyedra.AAC.1
MEEAVRRAQSDEEARLTFLRLQMERAVEEGFQEGPMRHCPCCVQILPAYHCSCFRCGAYFL